MEKSLAIKFVNGHLGHELLKHSNTSFSNINGAKSVWWLEPKIKRFKNELHLLLAKDRGLIWLRIKANTFPNLKEKFRYRPKKECVSLEISSSIDSTCYMHDIRSEYDFHPHIACEWDDVKVLESV